MVCRRLDPARANLHLENVAFALLWGGANFSRDEAILFFVKREDNIPRLDLTNRHKTSGRVDARIAAQTLILSTHTGQIFALGFRDAQLLEGIFDLGGQVVPGFAGFLCGFDVVIDVVEVNGAEVAAPGGHWFLVENVKALMAEVSHPLRLALHLRDFFDDFVRETLACLEHIVLRLAKAPLILLQLRADIRLRTHVIPPVWNTRFRGGAIAVSRSLHAQQVHYARHARHARRLLPA